MKCYFNKPSHIFEKCSEQVYNGSSNFIQQGTGTVWENNITNSSPLFIDPANNNFQLQSDSPAINTGMTIAEVSADIAGISRPRGTGYDIGAYEYVEGRDITPPAAPSGLRVN